MDTLLNDSPLPSLGQAVEHYLGWLLRRKDRSPGTVDGYRDDLWRFVRFAEARGRAANVGDVDRSLLEAYQEELARARVKRAGATQRLAASTRQRRLVALRSFLRFGAVQQAWFAGDLGATIDLPKLGERLPKPIEEEHRTRLRAALEGDTPQRLRDCAMVLFLLSTGCRISEALELNRQDVLGNHTVVRGKGNKERSVELTERARHALGEYLAARDDPSPALFISLHHDRLVNQPELNRLSVRGAEQICERLSREAGIPRFHPHQLRHTLGTLLQEQVGDARLTAETLGHVGLASVSGYTKVSDRRRREAYDRLEDAGL